MDSADIWWRNGVIYQVYPRSFADSNHDGIGDLNGILEKLDYVKDLGADAIWLSPIFPSPNIDFGYDISDYQSIDPLFGSMQVFNQLVSEAHSRGIRIILDLVLNHSSDQHPWFQESRSSRDNPYRDWYIWQDAKPGNTPPNNWRSWFGGGGWEYDSITGQYYYHGFYKEQPDLNWRKPQMRRAMLDVFSFWLDHGVDGFRLDVFNQYFKDSAFRDNPHKLGLRMFDQQKHIYDTNQPEMIPLLQEIRRLTDQYDERYIIGETFFSTLETAASYCVPGLLHGTFQFGLISRRWNPGVYLKNIQQWEKVLSPESWPSQVMNNHDTQRSASRFGQGEDDERLKVAAALLLTLRECFLSNRVSLENDQIHTNLPD